MTDQQPENIVLVYLRRIDEKVDRVIDDLRDLKGRVTALDLGMAGLRREIASLSETVAYTNVRLDRLETRLERIERRLDLAEAPK